MRLPRLKPLDADTFHHCYNRVAGEPAYFPFGHVEKEQFTRILHRMSELYVVRVIAYQVMSNHVHVLVWTPADLPTEAETCARYTAYYDGKRHLVPGTATCERWRRKLRDISAFMGDVEQRFTVWFNRTRPVRRRGALWAGRFRNTVLECGLAAWDCWKYIELNPVRAGMVQDPADYRFCSFGAWAQAGRHPFADNVTAVLPTFRGLLGVESPEDIRAELRKEFARLIAVEAGQAPDEVEDAIVQAGRPIPFRTTARRRMRYWVDGLVIGSEWFVQHVMTRARGSAHMTKRRLTRAGLRSDGLRLCAYRQLRELAT